MVTVAQIAENVPNLTPQYLDVEPGTFVRQDTSAQQFHVTIHGYLTDALPDVDNIRVLFQGQIVHQGSWTARAHSRVIDFEVSTTEAANVIRNLRGASVTSVQVQFYDGSNLDTNSPIRQIPVVAVTPTFSGDYNDLTNKPTIPTAPPTPVVLQRPVNGSDSAGTQALTIPTGRTRISGMIWESNNDTLIPFEIELASLYVQTVDRQISMGGLFHNNQADRTSMATWSPRARTLTMQNNDRFIYAVVE